MDMQEAYHDANKTGNGAAFISGHACDTCKRECKESNPVIKLIRCPDYKPEYNIFERMINWLRRKK